MQPADPPTRSVATVPTRAPGPYFRLPRAFVRDGYSICATSPRLPSPPGPLLPGRRGRGFTLARPPFFFSGYVEARAETGPTPPLLNTQRALHIRSDAQRAISSEAKPDTETEHGYGCGCGVACGRMFPRKTTRTAQYLEAAKKSFFRDGFFFLCIGF